MSYTSFTPARVFPFCHRCSSRLPFCFKPNVVLLFSASAHLLSYLSFLPLVIPDPFVEPMRGAGTVTPNPLPVFSQPLVHVLEEYPQKGFFFSISSCVSFPRSAFLFRYPNLSFFLAPTVHFYSVEFPAAVQRDNFSLFHSAPWPGAAVHLFVL